MLLPFPTAVSNVSVELVECGETKCFKIHRSKSRRSSRNKYYPNLCLINCSINSQETNYQFLKFFDCICSLQTWDSEGRKNIIPTALGRGILFTEQSLNFFLVTSNCHVWNHQSYGYVLEVWYLILSFISIKVFLNKLFLRWVKPSFSSIPSVLLFTKL